MSEVDIAEIPLKRSQETFVDDPECIADINQAELSFDLEHDIKNVNSLHVLHAIVLLRNTVETIMGLQSDPKRFQEFRKGQLNSMGIYLDENGIPRSEDTGSNNQDISTPPHSPPLKMARISKEASTEYPKNNTPESTDHLAKTVGDESTAGSHVPIEVLLKKLFDEVKEPITSCSSIRTTRDMQVANKQKEAAQYTHLIKAFDLASEPEISVEGFLMRVNTYSSSTSVLVYVHAAFLIYKLAVVMDILPLSLFNVHRVILSLIRCLTKKLEDVYQSQTNYATVVGVSKKDLLKLEVGFLFLCNFQLVVGELILNDFVKKAYVNLLQTRTDV